MSDGPVLLVNLDRMEYISSLAMGAQGQPPAVSGPINKYQLASQLLLSNAYGCLARTRRKPPTPEKRHYLEWEKVGSGLLQHYVVRPRSAGAWCGDRIMQMDSVHPGADKLRLAEQLEAEYESLMRTLPEPEELGLDHYQYEKSVATHTTPPMRLYDYITMNATDISDNILRELREGDWDQANSNKIVAELRFWSRRLVMPGRMWGINNHTTVDMRMVPREALFKMFQSISSREELKAFKRVLRANPTLTEVQRELLKLVGCRGREVYITNNKKWREIWQNDDLGTETVIPANVMGYLAARAVKRECVPEPDPNDWIKATLYPAGSSTSQRRLIDME